MKVADCWERICAAVDRVHPGFSRNVMRRAFTGLEGLDRKLTQAIRPKKFGYFVELGANDGLRQSNTYKLQKTYKWTGLLIEPSPRNFFECIRNRSFGIIPSIKCAACVSFEYSEKFVEIADLDLMAVAKGLSMSDERVMRHIELGQEFLPDQRFYCQYGALARSLTSLLEEANAPNIFDLLSLDVEGNELDVLKGLDFTRYRPRWILAECRDSSVPRYLDRFGYRQYEVLNDSGTYRDILFCSA